jgi:hypothetical protein
LEKGGLFLKDAAALSGIGILGRNNQSAVESGVGSENQASLGPAGRRSATNESNRGFFPV